jgi:vesicle transport through interaction with t-SNAREs 1
MFSCFPPHPLFPPPQFPKLKSMNLSARSVPDSGPLQQKMQQYEEKLKQARKDLRRAQTAMQEQSDRDDLFAGGMRTDLMESSMDQREAMLSETERLQQTNVDLRDTIAVAESTFDIGVNTMNDLDRQKSQMFHIRDNLDDINTNLGKARHLLRSMYQRALANKAVTALITLVLLVGIFLIIYFKWIEPNTPDPQSSDPDASAQPPPPSGSR